MNFKALGAYQLSLLFYKLNIIEAKVFTPSLSPITGLVQLLLAAP